MKKTATKKGKRVLFAVSLGASIHKIYCIIIVFLHLMRIDYIQSLAKLFILFSLIIFDTCIRFIIRHETVRFT
jgi:hypothetical protein